MSSKLIKNMAELRANIKRFENARKHFEDMRNNGQQDDVAEAYEGLLKRGKRFVPYVMGEELGFAPAKFLGYVGNDVITATKLANQRSGTDAKIAINKILGSESIEDIDLYKLYRKMCKDLGVGEPKPAFGGSQYFWLTDEIKIFARDYIEDRIEENIRNGQKTNKKALIDARRGQGKFRKKLLKYWRRKCALTGCECEDVLRASHVKPWRDSNDEERLDPYNGLLLTANADALFDSGLISFNKNGKIKLSLRLSKADRKCLGINPRSKIRLKKKHQSYLDYHRKEIFQ